MTFVADSHMNSPQVLHLRPLFRVAAIQQESDNSEDDLLSPGVRKAVVSPHQAGGLPTLESLEGEKRKYMEQIRKLEGEIQLLEDEVVKRESPLEMTSDDELERAM